MFLVDWRLCCMLLPHNPYRLPQHYKRHVCGPFCSCVNIDFCGYLRFFSISFVSIIWVRYATDHLSGQQLEFVPYTSVDISTHSELHAKRYTKASCVLNSITHWENCAVAMCQHMNQGFWRGLGGGGGPFWLHRETWTFMGPAAYWNIAVLQVGVNRIPPNFNTLYVMSLCHSAI